ncbi:HWE histidine kinase domain-containing protein [Pontivivens insulae]|uniref:histidine kinase n=1 Tax=Pontivivens insulae TaxID=1639689 RepID=A0A2R8A6V7_9RHOB|nr:HWE histidine kinase domain-containing protein [Pontivivens insulae]RED18072.1 light-regulated signal transduction histidine kinase (bacteriophytochrome) [Pontivivens insulae]SPF27969.1 Bacteriophytochrome [Pontivivens insulae]
MSEQNSVHHIDDVDLTSCDREPIHQLGHVQNYGALIACSSDWNIAHISMNVGQILGIERSAGDLVGVPLRDILPEKSVHDLRSQVQMLAGPDAVARLFDFDLFEDGRPFDIAVHQSGQHVILEFEQRAAGRRVGADSQIVQGLLARIRRHGKVEDLAREAARGLKMLTGYDRVMVYRFEEDGSGTVAAEFANPGMEPFLGLRYPATDIPKQARALYKRNLLRLIEDVDGQIHPIEPRISPDGTPPDLSLAATRAVSPIHLEYLRNMGVGATLTVSILCKGELWGLFSCHHNSPRHIGFEKRMTVELFSQFFNYELNQRLASQELEEIERANQMHGRFMSRMSGGESLLDSFETFEREIAEVISFDGIAIFTDSVYRSQGRAPTAEEFSRLARFLNTAPPGEIYKTDEIVARYPQGEEFADRAAGFLALPISRKPRDYIVFFRQELAQSVNWAGDPNKAAGLSADGRSLTPRNSFASWRQIVRGKCQPWTTRELRAADALRVTLLEVVLKMSDDANAARARAAEQQELLIAELNHRVRNILNLIRGLVSQTGQEAVSVESYTRILDDRISALARAHDQLTNRNWDWVPLKALIRTELQAFESTALGAVDLTGHDIDLSPAAFSTMALVIHELMTNAVKYGALRSEGGKVAIHLAIGAEGEAHLSWQETGGPKVETPSRRGFGTTIIERSIPYEMQGKSRMWFNPGGLEVALEIPARHVAAGEAIDDTDQDENGADDIESPLSGAALVVEDNMIIAMEAVDILEDLGATRVETAGSVAIAMEVLGKDVPEFVLLDVNLGTETSAEVLKACLAQKIPVILATGYGERQEMTLAHPNVPVVAKPYTKAEIRKALAGLRRA